MADEPRAYRLEVPAFVRFELGRDPERLPEHEAAQVGAVRTLLLCSSLFWVVRQLGMMRAHGGWVYEPEDLACALMSLGEIGQALTGAASDQVARLERLAARGGAGSFPEGSD